MSAWIAVLLAACEPPARLPPDPALAAVYAQVAREEAARGARDAAMAAWLRAAELGPPGSEADQALARLCTEAEAPAQEALDRQRAPLGSAWRTPARERLLLEASLEAGWDSNATLASMGDANDGVATGLAVLTFRPLGRDGLFVIAGGGYRKQLFYGASDIGLVAGTVGWDQGFGPLRAVLDGGADFILLGGAPWLVRPRGTVQGRLQTGALQLSGEYTLRYEQVLQDAARDDTGLRHLGELAAAVTTGPFVVELAAVAQRGSAATAARSFVEAGGALRFAVQSPTGRLTLDGFVDARWRGYDAVDVDLGVARKDTQVELRLQTDYGLGAAFGVFAVLEGRFVASSVPELSYVRAGASAGLRVRVGLW